jgi:hypothetical protein
MFGSGLERLVGQGENALFDPFPDVDRILAAPGFSVRMPLMRSEPAFEQPGIQAHRCVPIEP